MPKKSTLIAAPALALFAPASSAQFAFFDSVGGGSSVDFASNRRVEARFKADSNNWDSRLEFDSFPNNGDATSNVANGRSSFENRTFGFELSYVSATSELSWTVTRPDAAERTITQTLAGFGNVNLLSISTNGASGPTTLSNLSFVGSGVTVADADFPSLDTDPSGSTFLETFLYFGESVDLLAADFSFAGDISFGTFNRSNPGERNKITLKLREAAGPIPAAPTAFALVGLAAGRRER